MEITFLGFGKVGAPLADQLQRLGHGVTLAAANPQSHSLEKALARNPKLKVAPPRTAVGAAQVVFMAVPFQAAENVLKSVSEELKSKILVDCSNPVGPNLTHGLNSAQSATEVFQKLLPETRVVKAFNIYGYEIIENNRYPDYAIKPIMPYCGQDKAAKETVAALIIQLGWEPLDVGGLEQALHMEHITLLWVRMVRRNGQSPSLAWAKLTR